MKNIKISVQLIIGFLLIILISFSMMIFAIIKIKSVTSLVDKLYKYPYTISTKAITCQRDFLDIARELRGAILFEYQDGTDDFIRYENHIYSLLDSIYGNMEQIESLFLGDKNLVIDCNNFITNEVRPARIKVMELIKSGDFVTAKEYLENNYRPLFLEANSKFQEIVESAKKSAIDFNNDSIKIGKNTANVLFIICIVIIIVSIAVSTYIIHSITKPVNELDNVAKKIADGNLDVMVNYESKNEFGVLANNFNKTVIQLREYVRYIDEIAVVLQNIGDGNLAFKLQHKYTGEFAKIKHGFDKLSTTLNETLSNIIISASQVSSGSDQMSSGAQLLAHGVTEQANSIEELSTSITQISNQVKQNAKNSQKANNLVENTVNSIKNSNEQMKQLIISMNDINIKSKEISNIIKTIEDISFKTNILAINIAIEASRAGLAGNCFTVVAEEVRNLAIKSTEATKNTSKLIKDCVLAIDDGVNLTDITANELNNAVEAAVSTMDVISEITKASNEQELSIQQVTDSLDQISSVVQNNSATSEESAAASEELSSQANIMKNLVSKFKLKDKNFI